MLSSTCRVCAATSPTPTVSPPGPIASVPDTNSQSPARVPGEYGASGGGDPGGMIGVIGIVVTAPKRACRDIDRSFGGDLRTRKGVLDELLLDRAEMRAHRFLGERGIATGDRHRDAAMGGGVLRLPVDAMSGFAAVPPAPFRRDLQHRVEDRDQQWIARRR